MCPAVSSGNVRPFCSAKDTHQPFPTTAWVREEYPHSKNHSQQALGPHSPISTLWVAKSLQTFQKGLWSGKVIILETAFLTLSFEDLVLAKQGTSKGDHDCLRDTRLQLPSLGTHPVGCTSAKEYTSYYETANVFSIQKETINRSYQEVTSTHSRGTFKVLVWIS